MHQNGDPGRSVCGADLLLESLASAGVTTMFGLPGDTGVALYDALSRQSEIRHILARDERHAAFMADAYARVTNTVGVVEVSSGGGTTYVVGGLGEAYASSIPVLVLTSDIQSTSRGSGALTEIDQVALFAAVTKWQCRVDSAADIPASVDEAIRMATSGRPGPVALIIPEEVFEQQVMGRSAHTIARSSVSVPRRRDEPEAQAIAMAAHHLTHARFPAIVAGSGVHLSEAWPELESLSQKLGIPVATTIHGKGAVSTDNRWSLGIVGGNGGAELANTYVREADVVMFVGTRANATDTDGYSVPPREDRTIISIDIDAERAGRNYPGGLRIVGDARIALEQLISESGTVPALDKDSRLERMHSISGKILSGGKGTCDEDGGRLRAADVIATLAGIIAGRDHVVLADPGTPTPYVANTWPVLGSGRRSVLCPRGHGPMGYALPASVGAALAKPEAVVLALVADGSFSMSCGELETVNRLGLPIIFVQLTNNSLGWIKMLQHLYEGRRYFGVDPGPTDAVMVARANGLKSERIHSLDDLTHYVEEAIGERRSIYLDVPVIHLIQDVPPVSSWHAALAGDLARPVY